MDAVQTTLNFKDSDIMNDAMQTLFRELDKAIDDMENGRVLSEEEMWAEIDDLEGDAYGEKTVSD